MRVLIPILFLTLVVNVPQAWSAPTTKTTLDPAPLKSQSDPLLDSTLGHEKMPTTEINVALGYTGGNLLENSTWTQAPVFSLRYSPLDLDQLPIWDVQVELNKDNVVGVFAGRRWYIRDDDYQPYVRLAGGSFFDSSSELGNLVQIKRWRLRTSFGIGTRFNFEFGFGVAVTGPDLFTQLGYNFDF